MTRRPKGHRTGHLRIQPRLDAAKRRETIRLVVPQLTEDRRKELVKDVKAEMEKAKVAVRVCREAMDDLKKGTRTATSTTTNSTTWKKQVQEETDAGIKNLEQIAADKEKELLEG